MKRSKSKTIYFKWPSRENLLAYKKKKKKSVTLTPNILKKRIFEK